MGGVFTLGERGEVRQPEAQGDLRVSPGRFAVCEAMREEKRAARTFPRISRSIHIEAILLPERL